MPEISHLWLFVLAGLTLNLTPGPDMLYVMARSVGQGRAAGVASALGIAGGGLVHTLAGAVGLSAVIMSSVVAFSIIKIAGAIYLVYLGANTLIGYPSGQQSQYSLKNKGHAAIFRQGVVTNVLNPKVAFFFLAFLPQFVDPANGSVAAQFIFLGVVFNVVGTGVNLLVALAGGWMRASVSASPRIVNIQRWFTGCVFIGLGVRLALLDRK